ncbi:PAK4-inhibitor INKA2 isoform X2 [Hyla sarda]|nr:PAK4-inhibitor INKA2 isoform X2 [Hyla sarda]XP_056414248.1 PAK4-inhibitor INKA2 isoform X2 [Hyla sarda]XP_056414249.1 PAK4-inhibitor INKA2 isoform X2 [Hyla sarda]XP_056414250.1 PAK4-inhibitor INKA2 isoform X2 [Hyla sarda]XP_056414251.1 PAK4-inhibitor INKA2 isoform X2 [Hyla sarda]
MKEVGEGLQEQMNSMMGALQELKLLQVQTALEQLEISGEQNQLHTMRTNPYCQNVQEATEVRHVSRKEAESIRAGAKSLDNSSLTSSRGSWAASTVSSVSVPGLKQGHQVLSASVAETETSLPISVPVDRWPTYESQSTSSSFCNHLLNNNIHSDLEQSSDDFVYDEANDWTSSLMSQSRNRQPLVLGDNIFADLVGNWLDLPEMEKKGENCEGLLGVNRSHEIYKKFSLTASFFKKVLRSVRPDRDKLLKEKPGWPSFEDQKPQIYKRGKKPSKQKSVFYFPSANDFKSKVEKPGRTEGKSIAISAKKDQKPKESMCKGFDMNTVVWV